TPATPRLPPQLHHRPDRHIKRPIRRRRHSPRLVQHPEQVVAHRCRYATLQPRPSAQQIQLRIDPIVAHHAVALADPVNPPAPPRVLRRLAPLRVQHDPALPPHPPPCNLESLQRRSRRLWRCRTPARPHHRRGQESDHSADRPPSHPFHSGVLKESPERTL